MNDEDTSGSLITLWSSPKSEVDAAMEAAVTEVAFFTLTTENDLTVEAAKRAVEGGLEGVCSAVKEFGKAKGAGIGWGEWVFCFRTFTSVQSLVGELTIASCVDDVCSDG